MSDPAYESRVVAYADPPYPGQSRRHYKDHPDYAGEVDHDSLLERLSLYDGWVLHTASTTLKQVLALCPDETRVMAWCKSFAAFKKNVPVAYTWEPVLVKIARKRPVDLPTLRDWLVEPITLERGLSGVKPDAVIKWLLEAVLVCAEPADKLDDLFPGSGAVARVWEAWRAQGSIFAA